MRAAPRTLCEDCLKLDLAEPVVRAALDPERVKAGTISWHDCGVATASMDFAWTGAGAILSLRWSNNTAPAQQMIKLTSTTPNFGGRRWWFTCPLSSLRARVLYLPPGSTCWASRGAHRLAYAGQRMTPRQRQFRQLLAGDGRGDCRNQNRRLARQRRRGAAAATST